VTDVQSSYTKKLLTTVPPGLFDTVLLVNSGSEAVDLALRLAQNYTKRKDIICNQPSVFGHSSTLASFNYRYIKVGLFLYFLMLFIYQEKFQNLCLPSKLEFSCTANFK